MSWFTEMAILLNQDEPNPATRCAHETHTITTTKVQNGTSVRPVDMVIFDPVEYRDTEGYCVGDDDVSRTLNLYGRWEPANTEVFGRCVASSPGGVIDFGCHIGWYSLIALRMGHEVLSIDAVPEHLALLGQNVLNQPDWHRLEVRSALALHWVGPDSPDLHATDDDLKIAMVKIDIEGNEEFALRMIDDLLPYVANIMLEVSPCFNDSYYDILQWLVGRNEYHAAVIDPWKPFGVSDIATVIDDMPQFDVILSRNPYWS